MAKESLLAKFQQVPVQKEMELGEFAHIIHCLYFRK